MQVDDWKYQRHEELLERQEVDDILDSLRE